MDGPHGRVGRDLFVSVPIVKQAILEGYTFTCATCTRLHQARAKKLDGCMAKHLNKPCFGPFGGGFYPEYKGPLEGQLANYCFVCGDKSDGAAGIRTPDGLKLVGVCESHMKRLEDTGPPGERPKFLTHEHLPVVE
jgi:hypothetical protein